MQLYRKNLESGPAGSNYFACVISSAVSAFLLSTAHSHPEIWFISLFSLVPFLARVKRSGWSEMLVSSVSFASIYAILMISTKSLITPQSLLLKIGLLNLIFVVFGMGIKLLHKSIWFNPVFIAALWLPLEFAINRYIGLGAIFALPDHGHDLVYRMASMFGFLTVSFFIILINSIILLLFDQIFLRGVPEFTYNALGIRRLATSLEIHKLFSERYFTINTRAPPAIVQFFD